MEVKGRTDAEHYWNVDPSQMVPHPHLLFRTTKAHPQKVWFPSLDSFPNVFFFIPSQIAKWWAVVPCYLNTRKIRLESRDQSLDATHCATVKEMPVSSLYTISASLEQETGTGNPMQNRSVQRPCHDAERNSVREYHARLIY